MEISCDSVKLTTVKGSVLICAGGNTASSALLVSALVKAQLVVSVLSQVIEFLFISFFSFSKIYL